MDNDIMTTMVCWAIWFALLLAGLGVLLFMSWPEIKR